jgi:hypothetical protein
MINAEITEVSHKLQGSFWEKEEVKEVKMSDTSYLSMIFLTITTNFYYYCCITLHPITITEFITKQHCHSLYMLTSNESAVRFVVKV